MDLKLTDDKPRVLFVPRSLSRAGYYRCVLPAMYGDAWDWAAIDGTPPALSLISSWVGQASQEPKFLSYDVVVFQQVRGKKWANLIRKLRTSGVKVLYEIDDYVHGIRKLVDHDFVAYYQKDHLKAVEECMRCCDGMIVSTEYLVEKYRRFARDRPIYLCENGIDMGRYRLTRPQRGIVSGRETVTILWAGATGHQIATMPWIAAVAEAMRRDDHVTFVSIGQDFAGVLKEEFSDRVMSIPFTAMECYPAAMMAGDITIAPAGTTDWARAKSDLRAMESAALGIPVVAARHYENSVATGEQETGIVVDSPSQVVAALSTLVRDDERRLRMSENSRALTLAAFAMERRVSQWSRAFDDLLART